MSEQIALPKIDTCRKCGKQVIINEERGDFTYSEFFTDGKCFNCFQQRQKSSLMCKGNGHHNWSLKKESCECGELSDKDIDWRTL